MNRLTAAAAVGTLVVAALLPAGCTTLQQDQALPLPDEAVFTSIGVEPSVTASDESSTPPPSSSAAKAPSPEPVPEAEPADPPIHAGALVGNKQRTWPGGVDDSMHAEPGAQAPDAFLGRPAHTPLRHDGDFPAAASLRDGSCAQFDGLEGTTQQQYVNARYMVVNEQAGPSKAVRAVPRGYAHSPAGALVAAMNTGTFHPNSGDEVAAESYELLSKSSELAAQLREEGGHNNPGQYAEKRFLTVPAPTAYKMLECADDYVQVELAYMLEPDALERDEGLVVSRMGMRWVDGDWVADFSGAAGDEIFQDGRRDLNGFTQIDYV